jgi:hypothetical protein
MTKPRILFLSVGLLAFFVYVCTLAPTITWRNDGLDSGDLATAVAVGGVPHPPGYPTYLVLGEVFKLLPLGDVAYRLNLLSAVCAAWTVAVSGLVIHQTLSTATRHQAQPTGEPSQSQNLIWLCAVSTSLTLAFSGVFWSQAVIAEVYALNVLFAALLLYGALLVQPANETWLAPGLFGLLGLSLGNHPSILLWLPMLMGNLKARWRWRLAVAAFLAFCAGLSVYLMIPIRAGTFPPVNWGMATTWPNFLWLVSGEPYRQYLFALPWKFVPARIVTELRLLAETFMGWGLPVGFLGLGSLVGRNRPLAGSSLLTFFLISGYAIGYNTTDSYVYLLPAFLIFSVWIGWGLYDLGNALQKVTTRPSLPQVAKESNFAAINRLNLREAEKSRLRSGSLISGVMLLLPLLSLALNFPHQNISQDSQAYAYAQRSLRLVAHGAVIITEDDPHTFALWYARYGLAWRPDVAIVNSNLLPYAWYRQTLRQTHANLRLSDQSGRPLTTLPAFIELNVSSSPIYLATQQPPTLEGYRLEPLDHLQRVVKLRDG